MADLEDGAGTGCRAVKIPIDRLESRGATFTVLSKDHQAKVIPGRSPLE
jgi:hypothetical protein